MISRRALLVSSVAAPVLAAIAKLLMDMNEWFADLLWIEGKNETP